ANTQGISFAGLGTFAGVLNISIGGVSIGAAFTGNINVLSPSGSTTTVIALTTASLSGTIAIWNSQVGLTFAPGPSITGTQWSSQIFIAPNAVVTIVGTAINSAVASSIYGLPNSGWSGTQTVIQLVKGTFTGSYFGPVGS